MRVPVRRRVRIPSPSGLRLRPALVSVSVVIVIGIVGVSIAAGGDDSAVPVPVYLLCIGLALVGLGAWWLLQVVPSDSGDHPPLFRRRRSGPPPRDVSAHLGSDWAGLLAAGARSGRAATMRLVPRLQALTRARLLRRGVDPETDPGAAAALLGPEAWATVDPGRPRPTDRGAPGLDPAVVEHLVDRLEQL